MANNVEFSQNDTVYAHSSNFGLGYHGFYSVSKLRLTAVLRNQLAVPLKLTCPPKFESSGGNSLNIGIWADMLIARGKTILIPHF